MCAATSYEPNLPENSSTNSSVRAESDCSITFRASRAQSSISTARTTCFTRGTAPAFMLKLAQAKAQQQRSQSGLAAISPQTETGMRIRSAASVANCTRRSTAGCSGS